MSIRVMTLIWDTCLYQSGTLNVLLALADHASDDGRDIYPGMEYLAAKCRQTVRGTQDCVKNLRDDGVLILLDKDGQDLGPDVKPIGGRGRRAEYRINLERVRNLQGLHRQENPDCKHCAAGKKTANQDEKKGEHRRGKGELRHSPIEEPSIEPSKNLSPAGAGESENVASLKESRPDRWPDFRDTVAQEWPRGFPATDMSDTIREFDRACRLIDPEMLIACAKWHGEKVRAENATRGSRLGPLLEKKPSNWLRQGCWKGYVAEIEKDRQAAQERERAAAAVREALGPDVVAGLKRARISESTIDTMAGALFEREPTPRLVVPTPFLRSKLQDRGPELNDIWPGIRIELAERRPAA